MKKIILSVLLLFSFSLGFITCSDDEKKPADVLVTSNRVTGVFYKIDKETGETTEIFTPTIADTALTEIRAFVYHPGEKQFFASAHSYVNMDDPRSGLLFRINPKTKAATLINDNDGNGGEYAVWDAIVNWAVAEDDSLICVGDFNADASDGIVKFGTDGGRSGKTIAVDFCCGLGLLYDKSTGIMLVGNSEDSEDGEVIISTINAAGVITEDLVITTLNDFPDDLSVTWLNLKAMAKDKNGTVYGILFHNDLGKSYFVEIDMEKEEVNYISTLGNDYDDMYSSLAFIPGEYAK